MQKFGVGATVCTDSLSDPSLENHEFDDVLLEHDSLDNLVCAR